MIKYSLTCDRDHSFDSWFRDSLAFDLLADAGGLQCPACASAQVRKSIMAPSIVSGRTRALAPVTPSPTTEPKPDADTPKPVALFDDRERKLRDMLRDMHRKVTETADNVGRAFPEEARRIHEGDAPPRSIYGEATREQVSALLDDGIPLFPMPSLPDDQN